MNLRKAISDYIQADADLSPLVGDRVYIDRATADTASPCIVYTIDGYTNQLGDAQGVHGLKGWKVTIDVIGNYEQIPTLENIQHLIGQKFGCFNGVLTADRKGGMAIVAIDNGYDENTSKSVYRTMLLCKETF